MADLGQMVVRIIGDNSQLDTAIDKSQTKLKSFGDIATKLGAGLSLAVTTPLIALAAAAVKSSATMEMLQASFETMLGSAKKATALMTDLKKMAAITPFETTDLAQASKTLLQFGVSAEKLLPTLQMIGDAAGGSSSKFSSMALVFGQISSLGRLQGQDLIQLINAGFNPLNEIAKKTGESMMALKDRMSKGGISAQEVSDAFKSATSEGGKFYKGMDTASRTFEGLVSTLNDDTATMGRAFSDMLMPVLKDAVKGLSSMAQWVSNLDAPTKTAIMAVGAFAASLGPLALGIKGVTMAMSFLAANPIVLTLAAVAAGIAAVVGIVAVATAAQKKYNDSIANGVDLYRNTVEAGQTALGVVTEKNEQDLITNDQITNLVKLYPNLTGVMNSNNTTMKEAVGLVKAENEAIKENALKKEEKLRAGLLGDNNQIIYDLRLETKLFSIEAIELSKLYGAFLKKKNLQQDASKELSAYQSKLKEFKVELGSTKEALAIGYGGALDENNKRIAESLKRTAELKKEIATPVVPKVTPTTGTGADGIGGTKTEEKKIKALMEVEGELQKYMAAVTEVSRLETEGRISYPAELEQQLKLTSDYIDLLVKTGSTATPVYDLLIAREKELNEAIQYSTENIIKLGSAIEEKIIPELEGEAYTLKTLEEIDAEYARQMQLGSNQQLAAIAKDQSARAANADFKKTTFQKELEAIDKQAQAYRDAGVDEVAVARWAALEKSKLVLGYFNQALNAISSFVSKMADLYNQDVTNRKNAIAVQLAAALKAVDADLKAKLKAAGLAEKTAKELADAEVQAAKDALAGKLTAIEAERKAANDLLDSKMKMLDEEQQALLYSHGLTGAATLAQYDAEIQAAINAGQMETASNLQKARDTLKIQLEYDAKRKAAEEAAAKELKRIADQKALDDAEKAAKKAALEEEFAAKKLAAEKKAAYDTYLVEKAAFKTNQDLAIVTAVISAAQAILQCYAQLGPIAGSIAAAITAGLTAVQIELIKNQTPPSPPALAEGGIVMPKTGGTLAQIAEAGQPEAVFPLDKLDQFISKGTFGTGSSGGDIHLVVQLDSKPFLDTIFPATRNKTVLISAKAIV